MKLTAAYEAGFPVLLFRDARLRGEDEFGPLPTPPEVFKAVFAEEKIRLPSMEWRPLICTGSSIPCEPDWLDAEVSFAFIPFLSEFYLFFPLNFPFLLRS